MTRNAFPAHARVDERGKITLSHGAGGLMSQALVEYLTRNVQFRKVGDGIGLDELDDGASIPASIAPHPDLHVVITSDGHTVEPLFFPGGDLGKLAACGTINDVLMMGATPVAMTSVVIVEEGFPIADLGRLNDSLVRIAAQARVSIIAGDTKVMPKGTLSGCISATTGIGFARKPDLVVDSGIKAGDDIVVSGTLGDHGTALLACRKGISFETDIVSDVRLLVDVAGLAKECGVHAMKDPTRGGIATALNELATKSNVSIWLDEERVPFKQTTISACEMLGLNPYEMACEGRAVMAVPRGIGDELVSKLATLPGCEGASVIGRAKDERHGKVLVNTRIGGTRILATPLGEAIPRVC